MSLAESMSARASQLAMLGWVLAMVDSLWGMMPALVIGFNGPIEIALDIGLTAGLPAYALDFWSKSRVLIFLPALYVLRWIVQMHAGHTPHVLSLPWGGSKLLIAASVLLQWYKLRMHDRAVLAPAR